MPNTNSALAKAPPPPPAPTETYAPTTPPPALLPPAPPLLPHRGHLSSLVGHHEDATCIYEDDTCMVPHADRQAHAPCMGYHVAGRPIDSVSLPDGVGVDIVEAPMTWAKVCVSIVMAGVCRPCPWQGVQPCSHAAARGGLNSSEAGVAGHTSWQDTHCNRLDSHACTVTASQGTMASATQWVICLPGAVAAGGTRSWPCSHLPPLARIGCPAVMLCL